MRGLRVKYLFLINKLVTFTEVKINEMNSNIVIQALFITFRWIDFLEQKFLQFYQILEKIKKKLFYFNDFLSIFCYINTHIYD